MTAEQRAEVRLTEAEREALHETSDHAPWHYTEFGVACSCGLAIIDHDRDYCQTMVNLEALIERILTNHAAAKDDPDLGVMAPRCPDCGWQADERPDDAAGRASAKAEVSAHLAGHRAAAEDHGLRAAASEALALLITLRGQWHSNSPAALTVDHLEAVLVRAALALDGDEAGRGGAANRIDGGHTHPKG